MKTAQNRCKAILSIVWRRRCAHHRRAHYLFICHFASSAASITAQRLGKAAYDYYSTNHHYICVTTIQPSYRTVHAVAASISQISREVPIHRRTIDRPICVLGHPSMLHAKGVETCAPIATILLDNPPTAPHKFLEKRNIIS